MQIENVPIAPMDNKRRRAYSFDVQMRVKQFRYKH